MTTDKYKLRDTISDYCSIPPILLDDFLNKLIPDDLEVLEMIVKDAYEAGEDSNKPLHREFQRGYDKGYEEGYNDGMDSGSIKNLHG